MVDFVDFAADVDLAAEVDFAAAVDFVAAGAVDLVDAGAAAGAVGTMVAVLMLSTFGMFFSIHDLPSWVSEV